MKEKISEFLKHEKTLNLLPSDFQVERMKKLHELYEKIKEDAVRFSFVKFVPCDVCSEQFFKNNFKRKLAQLCQEILFFKPEEMTKEILERIYPGFNYPSIEQGRLRIHGIDKEGKYRRYCYFCDKDMDEVYSGWDELYKITFSSIVPRIPEFFGLTMIPEEEWKKLLQFSRIKKMPEMVEVIVPTVKQFEFLESTSWLINLIVSFNEKGIMNFEKIIFPLEGRKFIINII